MPVDRPTPDLERLNLNGPTLMAFLMKKGISAAF